MHELIHGAHFEWTHVTRGKFKPIPAHNNAGPRNITILPTGLRNIFTILIAKITDHIDKIINV